MAIVYQTLNQNDVPTPEQLQEIENAKKIPITFDDDCPELTDEQMSNFKRSIPISIDYDNLKWLNQNQSDVQKQVNFIIRWAREHNCPLSIA